MRALVCAHTRAHLHETTLPKKSVVTKTPRKPPARATAAPKNSPARRIQVRRSGVHGKGVYAVTDLAKGDTLVEYVGEVITWTEALDRHPHDPSDPNHTFYFHVDEEHVIDAKYGGNSARWINHSCAPNCEADVEDGRVFIRAKRDIQAGERISLLDDEEGLVPSVEDERAMRHRLPSLGFRGSGDHKLCIDSVALARKFMVLKISR